MQCNSNAWWICIRKLNSKKSLIYESEILPDNVNITKNKGDCYPGFDTDEE